MCIKKDVGENMRNFRIERGMTQACIADLTGFSQSYIGRIERGEHNVGLENLEKFSRALRVPVSWFFELGPPRLKELSAMPSIEETPGPEAGQNWPVIHGPTFITMVRQCVNSPNAILSYLGRAGVRFSG